MNNYLGLSRRDVGAGLAAAGSAYVGASLFALFDLFSSSGSRGSPIATLGIIVTPVLALTVATVLWRVTMPDEPNPRYGAIAGAFSGAVSVLVFTTLIGITAALIVSPWPTTGQDGFRIRRAGGRNRWIRAALHAPVHSPDSGYCGIRIRMVPDQRPELTLRRRFLFVPSPSKRPPPNDPSRRRVLNTPSNIQHAGSVCSWAN
jgi:hypothetical protein